MFKGTHRKLYLYPRNDLTAPSKTTTSFHSKCKVSAKIRFILTLTVSFSYFVLAFQYSVRLTYLENQARGPTHAHHFHFGSGQNTVCTIFESGPSKDLFKIAFQHISNVLQPVHDDLLQDLTVSTESNNRNDSVRSGE